MCKFKMQISIYDFIFDWIKAVKKMALCDFIVVTAVKGGTSYVVYKRMLIANWNPHLKRATLYFLKLSLSENNK